jgi:hypothetical protein
MNKVYCLLLLTMLGELKDVGAANVEWPLVAGPELHRLFEQHELGDGTHYAYRFNRDGSFTGTELTRPVRGTWRTTPHYLCWSWISPAGAEECYEVRHLHNDVRMYRGGRQTNDGTLRPLAVRH